MKKYAFILMGDIYSPSIHQTHFNTEHLVTYLCTVRTPDEAKAKVLELADDGFGAIELCGAFGPDLAKELIALTNHKVAIGYVTHHPEQDVLFDNFFS